MVVKEISNIVDLDHGAYLKHQWHEISPPQIDEHARKVKPANHFGFQSGIWRPKTYEGFAVVSMMDNDASNTGLFSELKAIQDELINLFDREAFYLLPPSSFHQTIANTLSELRFRQFVQDPGLENEFPSLVRDAFRNISLPDLQTQIQMKLIGLSIFHTAIGILGVIESKEEYRQITSFRSQFYNDSTLNDLDVRMTRPFIGHVTLAYIEKDLSAQDRMKLAAAVNDINVNLSRKTRCFAMSNAELRRYHHLAEFKKEGDYPTFYFNP